MRALLLDFHDFRRRPTWPSVLLLVAGFLTAAYLGTRSVTVIGQLTTLEAERDALLHSHRSDARRAPLSAEDQQRLKAELKDANQVLIQLSLPWGALFKDIETSQQNEVALLAVVPDPDKGVVKISGEAKDLNAVIGYLRRLQKVRSLKSVYLASHHVRQRSAQRPVRFTLIAAWVIPR